jgi:ankyrin repeat protein
LEGSGGIFGPPPGFAVLAAGYQPFRFPFFMSFTSAQPQDVLFDAARRGDVATLHEMLGQGLDVNTTNAKGFTPLILASYDDHYDAVVMLLNAGADPNIQDVTGNSALMGVSFKGYPDVARLLIERGADLNLQNGNGGTALMFATMFGRNELVRILLEAGADTTIKDVRGLTALHLAGQQGNEEAWALLGGAPPEEV